MEKTGDFLGGIYNSKSPENPEGDSGRCLCALRQESGDGSSVWEVVLIEIRSLKYSTSAILPFFDNQFYGKFLWDRDVVFFHHDIIFYRL